MNPIFKLPTLAKQRRDEMFLPKNKIIVKIAADKYDNVMHMVKGQMKQRLKDITSVSFDVKEFDKTWKPLGSIDNNGSEEVYNLMNPTFKEMGEARKGINSYLSDHKHEDTLVTYLIAGHGMEVEGKQCFVLNELDPKTHFYKFWNAEYWIRWLARKYPRSYHTVYFACCREHYNKEKHTGCYAGPKKHAEETYHAEMQAKLAADESAK